MADPTPTWNIPQFDDNSAFDPIQAPFNAIGQALDTSLTLAKGQIEATRQIQTYRKDTLAELNALPNLVDGDQGFVSTGADKGEYLRSGGAWVGGSPFVSLGMAAAQNFTNTGVNTPVNWDVERSDSLGWHNPADPSKITVQQAGRYLLTRNVTNDSAAAGQFVMADFAINGTVVPGSVSTVPAVAGVNFPTNFASLIVDLAVGDYVQVRASVPTTGTYPIKVALCGFQLIRM